MNITTQELVLSSLHQNAEEIPLRSHYHNFKANEDPDLTSELELTKDHAFNTQRAVNKENYQSITPRESLLRQIYTSQRS